MGIDFSKEQRNVAEWNGWPITNPPKLQVSSDIFNSGVLTLREFIMHEPLPLAVIHDAVFEFLRGRDDVAVFGARLSMFMFPNRA